MRLLDLPPELCDEIFRQTVLIWGLGAYTARFVCKTFDYGITQAYMNVGVMRILLKTMCYRLPRHLLYNYIKLRILRDEDNSTYLLHTIRETLNALLQAENTTSQEVKAEKALVLARAAYSSVRTYIIVESLEGKCIWEKGYRRKTQTPKSPIHVLSAAVHDGNFQVVTELLKRGVSCNQSSQVFGPPLCIAAYKGNKEMVKLLLKFRADPAYFYRLHERSHPRTPLQAAAYAGHDEIVDLLLQPKLGVPKFGNRFYRALVFAARGGNFNTFKQLVDAAAPQNNPLFQWADCLMAACYSGSVYLVRFILYKGGDVGCMRRSDTPLILVARKGYHEIARALLEAGADPDYDSYCHSALTIASRYGRLEMVRLLLQFGACSNARFGAVPNAAAAGNKDIIQLLLDHGAQVSGAEPNKWGDTGQYMGQWAYRQAIDHGHDSLASWLLTLGVDMDNHIDTIYEWSCDESPIITSDEDELLEEEEEEGEGNENEEDKNGDS
ncbi:ankyrin [Nannizzia gypsea CBS 118893]|uniref:Ankyrin n=1 Tax=Arthroderma gypseum (strain ATCC MYA-4604 / CBS 118893) TaxID=535722 RepID=E4UVJ2_ARTGP|nr:ankyrin [Nannizzia gypsea CBS 118893]EFR02319.1 ankyrin [Nannizzia gypsea CBS 118893]